MAPSGVPAPNAVRSSAPPGPADWTALGHDLHGTLIRPGEAGYATARLPHNTRYDNLRPAGIAYVSGADGIATCLAFARRARIPVAIRSGGHSYADSSEHADLFWAVRGAGNGHFGVVTELRYRTHPAPACVTGYLTRRWPAAARVIAAWQGWGPDQADEIWSFPAPRRRARRRQRCRWPCSAWAPTPTWPTRSTAWRSAPGPPRPCRCAATRRTRRPWPPTPAAPTAPRPPATCHLPGTLPGREPSGTLPRDTCTARSDFYDRALPPAGIAALTGHVAGLTPRGAFGGGGAGSVALTALGGAVNRVPVTATAFTHRTSRFLAQYLASGTLSGSGWLDGLYGAMRPYASGGAYQHYAGPRLSDWRGAYCGPAVGRLTQVKRVYDPARVFDFPQAI